MQFVKPVKFEEAIDKLGRKSIIGSGLNSEQWSRVPLALRERAFFSATIESTRFLQRARDSVGDFLAAAREEITLPDGSKTTALKTGSRADFVKQMQDFAYAEGMGPIDPKHAGTIRDIRTEKRLGLIYDTQVRQAQDYGWWKQGQDPDVLDAFPAQRFIREREVKQERDYHRFHENEVQLKSDLGFWKALNRDFGVPWGPWGWGCGHDVEDVDRAEAERLGLIKPGERATPIEQDFNAELEASVRGLDDDMVDDLREAFGDQIVIDGDTARWSGLPKATSASPEPISTPGKPTLDSVLAKVGIADKETVTAADMARLVDELKEDQPLQASQVLRDIDAPVTGVLAKNGLQSDLQEFVNFIPSDKLKTLPKVQISTNSDPSEGGHYNPSSKSVVISSATVYSQAERKRVMFHELMHWLHMEGSEEFRRAVRNHFELRTKGETVKQLPGYAAGTVGKKDKWYEPYAGRIYIWEEKAQGLEIPTRYIEWLTLPPEKQAYHWNNPDFRETMTIILQALF